MNTAYLSLGSNLGNKPKFLNDAITQLGIHSDITMDRVSAFYKTEPVGVVDQDWFLNAVVKIETTLCPEALLARCQSIEAQFQRQRTRQWGPRTLDIDILLYSDLSMAREELTIPHPRMLERAFVLIPLQAIAPHMILAGKPITAYTQALSDQEIEIFSASSVHSPSLTSRGGSSQKPSSATPCTEILDTVWQGANLVTCFQGFPYRSLLDSSMQYTDHGQYTIFCYDPYMVFKSKGKQCTKCGAIVYRLIVIKIRRCNILSLY